MLQTLHVTDQKLYNNVPLFMRAVIQLSSDFTDPQFDKAALKLLHVVFLLIDAVAEVKMSPTVIQKCEKSRKKIKEQEQKANKEVEEEKKLNAKKE